MGRAVLFDFLEHLIVRLDPVGYFHESLRSDQYSSEGKLKLSMHDGHFGVFGDCIGRNACQEVSADILVETVSADLYLDSTEARPLGILVVGVIGG